MENDNLYVWKNYPESQLAQIWLLIWVIMVRDLKNKGYHFQSQSREGEKG